MGKPILYPISAFDATKSNTISFAYSGNSIIKSEAVFYNSETGNAVYGLNRFYNSPALEYVIPANTLTNSNTPYYVKIRVYDDIGGISDFSDSLLFYCVTTPTFKFNSLGTTGKNTFTEASHTFSVSYVRATGENEYIDSYSIILYDSDKNVLNASKTLYEPDIDYEFAGFSPNQTYYVRAIGETQNGMALDTGYIEIFVTYDVPDTYTILELTNRPKSGDILVKSNIVSVDGISNPSPPIYVNSNSSKAVDLTADGSYVIFNENFTISANFDIEVCMSSFAENKVFMTLKNAASGAEVEFYMCKRTVGSTDQTYCIMMAHYGNGQKRRYTIQSNYITYDNGYVILSIKRSNWMWSMNLANVEVDKEV